MEYGRLREGFALADLEEMVEPWSQSTALWMSPSTTSAVARLALGHGCPYGVSEFCGIPVWTCQGIEYGWVLAEGVSDGRSAQALLESQETGAD